MHSGNMGRLFAMGLHKNINSGNIIIDLCCVVCNTNNYPGICCLWAT